MAYQKTIIIHTELAFKEMQAGQWFTWYNGASGQYLGQTRSGTYVCRYGKFSKDNATRNKLQRDYAKQYARIKA